MGYYSLMKEMIALLLLTICGLWSIKNIRNMGLIRAVLNLSVNGTTTKGRSQSTSLKDRQFIFMLLMDITIYALFSFVFAIFLMYQ
jgi:hypothetical protein